MIRSLIAPLTICALLATASPAQDLMPPNVAARLGLTQAWARPVWVPAGVQSIASQQLFVHQNNPRQYVEIIDADTGAAEKAAGKEAAKSSTAADGQQVDAAAAEKNTDAAKGKVLARIDIERIGSDGKPIGRKEAERLANNEVRRLKRRGVNAKVSFRKVPRVHLYTIGTNGALECRDAESGEPIWAVRVGDYRLPYLAIGASEDFLTVINGANLIKVEAATGEVMEEVPTSGAPIFGATNTGDFALVPMIGGGVEGYPLNDPTRDPFLEIVAGAALTLPTKAPGSSRTAWGTDRGFVYVIEMQGTPSVLFRLNTDGLVSGRIASASGDRFFFGSASGQVYGLRATRSGEVLWSQPFGEPFYHEPMVVGEKVLLRSTYGNLFCLSVEDGSMLWNQSVPNIDDLIASFDGRVYVTTLTGSLGVIDLESGKVTEAFSQVRPAHFLPNKLTNRIYLISEGGDVQCLRPEDSDLPKFNVQPDQTADEEPEETKTEKKAGTPFDPGAADPFGAGGADPFGAGGADPFGAGGGADPFGGGADPFGGGGAGGGADPFGGGGGGGDAGMEDPFGGNPFGN